MLPTLVRAGSKWRPRAEYDFKFGFERGDINSRQGRINCGGRMPAIVLATLSRLAKDEQIGIVPYVTWGR